MLRSCNQPTVTSQLQSAHTDVMQLHSAAPVISRTRHHQEGSSSTRTHSSSPASNTSLLHVSDVTTLSEQEWSAVLEVRKCRVNEAVFQEDCEQRAVSRLWFWTVLTAAAHVSYNFTMFFKVDLSKMLETTGCAYRFVGHVSRTCSCMMAVCVALIRCLQERTLCPVLNAVFYEDISSDSQARSALRIAHFTVRSTSVYTLSTPKGSCVC